jgi:Fic-DOC domain mobile mystery protein B
MSLLFKNRKGQTPLEESMQKGLRLTHVQDMTELYEHEIENIAEAIAWTQSTNKDHMDYTVWLELHKHMLRHIWKWAGKIRTTELANPDFLMPYQIRPALLELEKDLKYWLQHKTYPPRDMIAIFHEKLLTIHPFIDGNGRWSRVLTEFICQRENVEVPNWGKSIESDEERRNTYIAAIKKARKDFDYQDLMAIMFYAP